jgi:hypothetical protein
MTIDLLQLSDLDISGGVACDLFIGMAMDTHRAKRLASIQLQHSKECWFLQSPTGTSSFPGSSRVEMTAEELPSRLKQWLKLCVGTPTVYLDVSCIPKPMIAVVLKELFLASETSVVNLVVGYVIAAYIPPPGDLPPNEDIKPIHEWFAGWPSDATATTALVVALGYERDKAEGACEYFDASETWVFVPNSPIFQYDKDVLENNKYLLNRVERIHRSLAYRVDQPANAFGQLVSIVLGLLPRANTVILPFGPKIFVPLSLIVAALYREVGVWHVTGDAAVAETGLDGSEQLIGFSALLGPGCADSAGAQEKA